MAKITVQSIGHCYRAELTGNAVVLGTATGDTATDARNRLVADILRRGLAMARAWEENAKDWREAYEALSQEQPKA